MLVDLAGDGEIFFVLRDVVEILVRLVSRMASENHVTAVFLLPDGQGMPEPVFVDGLEDERILVRIRLSEEVPCFRGWLQLIAWENGFEVSGDELFYKVIFRNLLRCRRLFFRAGFLHECAQLFQTVFRNLWCASCAVAHDADGGVDVIGEREGGRLEMVFLSQCGSIPPPRVSRNCA